MALYQYITENIDGIIQDTVFAFIGVMLGLLVTPKSNNSQTSNGSSVQNTKQVIYNSVYYSARNNYFTNPKKRPSSKNEDNSELVIFFGLTLFLAFIFVKYHAFIMNYLSGFILLALSSTITIAIQLNRHNQYDNLNRFWTVISLLIIGVNVTTLKLMSNQDISNAAASSFTDFISSVGITGALRYAYYALGFLFAQLPNVLLLILLLHMYAANIYLVKGGSISAYILKKTKPFTLKPMAIVAAAAILSTMSLLFSSGLLFDWIANNQTDTIISKVIANLPEK